MLCALLAFAAITAADDPPPIPTPPDQREIWVPTQHLAEVLAQYPRAVMLSREQYDTLLRDAASTKPKTPKPPQDAALTSSTYTARIEGKSLLIDGDLTIEVLTDSWAQFPLTFASVLLGGAQIDGDAALRPPLPTAETAAPAQHQPQGKPDPDAKAPTPPTILLIRGRGAHHLKLQLTAPITTESGSSRVDFQIPHAGAASFHLNLPAHSSVGSLLPFQEQDAPDATHITIAPSSPRIALEWHHAVGDGSGSLPPTVDAHSAFTVDSEEVRLDSELLISSEMGDLPAVLDFALPPSTSVLDLLGSDVASWVAEPGRLRVSLQPGHRERTRLHVVVKSPSLVGADRAKISLTFPLLIGSPRIRGDFCVTEVEGIAIRRVLTSATPALPRLGAAPGSCMIGSWEFAEAPAVEIIVEKLRPRFNADLDTLVEFKPEAVYIERTVTLHPEEGRLFHFTAMIPPGEELLSVKSGDQEPDWRLEGEKHDRLAVRWSGRAEGSGPSPGSAVAEVPPRPRLVNFRTRLEPKGWNTLGPDGLTVALKDAKIEGAERVTGYLALRAGEDFRLEANAPDSLEPRDGRATPIRGDYAWFRRDDFALGVKVMRRPAEITATLSGYALPLAGVLDLHAQIAWQFRHAGVRSVQVKTPAATAAQFHFEGPQIAERTLSGDTWTITFQKEITGSYDLTATVQIPVAKLPKDPARFQTEVPLIEPLNAQHTGGTWAVEANTDTEVTLTAQGMNELDAQLAPIVRNYQPRHRVIGVFTWLGGRYALRLEGVRHASGKVLSTVADHISLVSVVSSSGMVRTEAELQLRTIGEQFLDLTLPPGARLLSLSRNDEAIKPVQGEPGNVRVQLTAAADPKDATTIVVLYETAGNGEWSTQGKGDLPALHLPPQVPVLHSEWRVYLPDGFYYDRVKSNLDKAEEPRATPLLFAPWTVLREVFWPTIYGVRKSAATPAPVAQPQVSLFNEGNGGGLQSPPQRPDWHVEQGWNRPVHKLSEPPPHAGRTNTLQRKLDTIIIPKLELREATIREAIEFLKQKSAALDTAESDPSLRGVNIELKLGAELRSNEPATPRITVSLSNIPLGEALKYVTGLADMKYRVEQSSVWVIPFGTIVEDIATKEWLVPPDFILPPPTSGPDLDRQNARPSARPGAAPTVPVEDYLIASGVTFPPGTASIYLPESSKLIVKNTEENLNLIDTIVEASIQNQTPQQRKTWSRQMRQAGLGPQVNAEPPPPPASHASTRLQRKLDGIIIPKLELREATIQEAIEYLRQQSVALDGAIESDPARRGVNIVIKLDSAGGPTPPPDTPVIPGLEPVPGAQMPSGVFKDGRITVSLTNIPLREALRYVTGLANLEFKVEEHAVFVMPFATPTETLITKEWKVPPGFLSAPAPAPSTGDIDMSNARPAGGRGAAATPAPAQRVEAKDYLIASGVTFPPGASAIFLPNSSKLIVKDTQENLDLIEAIVQPAGQEPFVPKLYHSAEAMQTVGLIPLELDLPISGQAVNFTGLTSPDHVTFHFISEWTRARRLWLWFVAGAPATLLFAGRRPWWRTCWVVLLCTAISIAVAPGATAACNAFLLGWLATLILRRLAGWLAWPQSRKVVTA